jgi:prepilin-type N-terminal cleavage/methylation domain-containing protein
MRCILCSTGTSQNGLVHEQTAVLRSVKPGLHAAARAFTLTELLVVVAVVAVLAALQLAAITTASTQSHGVTCVSNLRQLTRGWLLYAEDNGGWFPPNVDDGSRYNWIGGVSGYGSPMDLTVLTNASTAKLLPYLKPDPNFYLCPAQNFRSRGYSANQAVGTRYDVRAPVNGPWLDNNFGHRANTIYRTYGRTSDLADQPPVGLWLIIGEDPNSINDGAFAFGMARAEWIDWPETVHGMAGGISFVDGHAEIRRWVEPTTAVVNRIVARLDCSATPADWQWLSQRTSVPMQ